MNHTRINLWFGDSKCFENVPALTGDGEMYVPLYAVRRMLEYQWPANRWGVMFNDTDPAALPADQAPDLNEHAGILASETTEAKEEAAPLNRMLDSLFCECGGKYEHVDHEYDGGKVVDSYRCGSCNTWCIVASDFATGEEISRGYETGGDL